MAAYRRLMVDGRHLESDEAVVLELRADKTMLRLHCFFHR